MYAMSHDAASFSSLAFPAYSAAPPRVAEKGIAPSFLTRGILKEVLYRYVHIYFFSKLIKNASLFFLGLGADSSSLIKDIARPRG